MKKSLKAKLLTTIAFAAVMLTSNVADARVPAQIDKRGAAILGDDSESSNDDSNNSRSLVVSTKINAKIFPGSITTICDGKVRVGLLVGNSGFKYADGRVRVGSNARFAIVAKYIEPNSNEDPNSFPPSKLFYFISNLINVYVPLKPESTYESRLNNHLPLALRIYVNYIQPRKDGCTIY